MNAFVPLARTRRIRRSVKAGYKLDALLDQLRARPGAPAHIGRDFRYRIHAFKQRNDYTRIIATIPGKYRVNSEAW